MHTCVLLSILAVCLFFTILPCQSESEGPPKDEYGNIICSPNDPLCEKFKQMNENGQLFNFRRNSYNFEPLRKGNHYFDCDTPAKIKICETIGKTCYANGKCGDLVSEEKNNNEVVFADDE